MGGETLQTSGLWGSSLICTRCPDTWIVLRKRMRNITITLQLILSEKELPAKIFTSSITSVVAEWLGSVLCTPSLSDLFWRLGSELPRAVVTVVSTGSPGGGGSGHCTWGWAKQLHRQSVHRQDGLVACICTVCLCLGTDSLSGSSSCPAGYITHCYLCAGLLDWWKPLADCPIPLFPPGWDLLKEKSSDITLSAFSGSENIPVQEPVFIQGRSYSV